MSTRTEVFDAVHTSFPAFKGELTDQTKAVDVDGWDSVSHVQLMFLIEEQTGKTIDIGHTFGCATLGDLVAYIDTCD